MPSRQISDFSHEKNELVARLLDLSWPDSCRERITYILFLPIILPLWLTLPDTRKQSGIISKVGINDDWYYYLEVTQTFIRKAAAINFGFDRLNTWSRTVLRQNIFFCKHTANCLHFAKVGCFTIDCSRLYFLYYTELYSLAIFIGNLFDNPKY